MAAYETVSEGRWTDFSTHRKQWTVTDYDATVYKGILAAFLTLGGTYVSKIALSTFMLAWTKGREFGGQHYNRPDEERPLLSANNNDGPQDQNTSNRNIHTHHSHSPQPQYTSNGGGAGIPHGTADIQASSTANDQPLTPITPRRQVTRLDPHSSEDDTASNLVHSSSGRAFLRNCFVHCQDENSTGRTVLTIIAFGLLAVFVGKIIAGIFAAKVASDNAALWSSESGYCGVWRLNSTKAGEGAAVLNDILYMRGKEARAGEYARNCYGDTTTLQSLRCNFFYRQKIKYNVAPSWDCSFAEEVCLPHQRSTITFDTGLIDVNDIGVNSKYPYKFRRRSNCSALSVEDRFVRPEIKNGITTYFYEYGTKGNSNFTYKTTGNPHDWHAPNYLVRAFFTEHPEKSYWKPIPALKPEPGSAVTILFTSALRIFYPEMNDDPVFPADREFDVHGDGSELWYWKSDPKARVIGCLDRNEMCTEDGTKCWTLEDEPTEFQLHSEYWFMKFALAKATIYDAIQSRLGDALVAQEMVTGFQSRDLVADGWKLHWMQEAERLFQTSLARIQFDAWSIGSGEDEKRVLNDGYSNYTDEKAGNLCGKFKFKSSRYTNILEAWYIGLLFLWPALWILATETDTFKIRYHWTMNKIRLCCAKPRSNSKSSHIPTARTIGETQDKRLTVDNPANTKETAWKPLVIHWLFENILVLICSLLVFIFTAIFKLPSWCRSVWNYVSSCPQSAIPFFKL